MRPLLRRSLRLLPVLCAWLAAAGVASAADLYVSGQLSMAGGTAESGGAVDLGPPGLYPNTGDDSDSSPVYGGALGYAFPLSELVPFDWDWPLPRWSFRVEVEGQGGRDYEFVTQGPDPYISSVDSWSLMQNLWLDLPIDAPVRWAVGRVPLLEPVTIHLGGGVGIAGTRIETTNNVFSGGTTDYHLGWQAGGGVGYRLTDRVELSLGYRYVDLGEHSFALYNVPAPDPVGSMSLDLASHELALGIRVAFFSVLSPGEWSLRRGR